MVFLLLEPPGYTLLLIEVYIQQAKIFSNFKNLSKVKTNFKKSKTHYNVLVVAAFVLLPSLLSCGKSGNADPQSGSQGSATIKLTQGGQVITEFQTTKAVSIGGGSFVVTISSPDEKHNLTVTIKGEVVDTYPIINTTEGKATILYQSYALPEVSPGTTGILWPETGEVVLKTATKTRCAGTFKGTGKNLKDGKTYLIEGTFDTPVVN
jgi:hypothetical protein